MRLACAYISITILILLKYTGSSAQDTYYFIQFVDKANSPFTLNNPSQYLSQRAIDRRTKQNITINQRDLPVSASYIDSISNLGATVWYTSKWMNGALISTDSLTAVLINTKGYVKGSQKVTEKSSKPSPGKFIKILKEGNKNANNTIYGMSYAQNRQINAHKMHDMGYRGEGMLIAVLDNGFRNVDILPVFDLLRNDNRILGTYDYVKHESNVFNYGDHGTKVLSTLTGYDENQLIGTAYKASYYLFQTEDPDQEQWIEEVNWLIAAEKADSLGVDVINSSLGYSTFQDSAMNYDTSDLDGNTTLITRAADFAAATGMLVVTSAGNSGATEWYKMTAPGDADSVIAVAAVDSLGFKASFSSWGPTADGRIQPSLAAMGKYSRYAHPDGGYYSGHGTSFSSPILCGMAAGFWQANPGLTNIEVISYLQQSASEYKNPNDGIGYGIPNFIKAYELATGEKLKEEFNIQLYPNPVENQYFNIKTTAAAAISNIKVYDVRGSRIEDVKILYDSECYKIDLPDDASSGTYIVEMHIGEKRYVENIVLP